MGFGKRSGRKTILSHLEWPNFYNFGDRSFLYMSSSVGSSTILRRSGYTKTILYFEDVVVFVDNTMIRGKVYRLSNSRGCLQRMFSYNAETLIPHYTAILASPERDLMYDLMYMYKVSH